MLNDDLQKAGARFLDSQTRLNNFSFVVGIGSVAVIIIFGLKLAGVFGL